MAVWQGSEVGSISHLLKGYVLCLEPVSPNWEQTYTNAKIAPPRDKQNDRAVFSN